MITVKDFMEVVNYRITEGSDYFCNGFGTNQYCLTAWNGDYDGWSANLVFDTLTQVTYMAEICDYKNKRAYRLINADYKDDFMKNNSSLSGNRDQAWDDVNYIDLETDSDFLEKSKAIVSGAVYDTRIQIPLTLSDSEMLFLFTQAHEADMTLNDYVEQILRKYLETEDKHDAIN